MAGGHVRIEQITFQGCPHAAEARANAEAAIAAAGLALSLREWDRDSADAPDYARHYPSPTILVDGRGVSGAAPADGGPVAGACCAARGAPSVPRVLAALSAWDDGLEADPRRWGFGS